MMPKSAELDVFDRALLRELQTNNQTPARVLAERIGLSQSAVLRRVKRLRAEGFIVADVSVVSPDLLGVPVSIHVLVSISQGSRTYGDFARTIKSRSEVVHASYVAGGADFILHLRVESMAAYAAFAKEVFHDNPNVVEYYTYVAMQEIVGWKLRQQAAV